MNCNLVSSIVAMETVGLNIYLFREWLCMMLSLEKAE